MLEQGYPLRTHTQPQQFIIGQSLFKTKTDRLSSGVSTQSKGTGSMSAGAGLPPPHPHPHPHPHPTTGVHHRAVSVKTQAFRLSSRVNTQGKGTGSMREECCSRATPSSPKPTHSNSPPGSLCSKQKQTGLAQG